MRLPPAAQRPYNGTGQQACGHLAVHRVRAVLAAPPVLPVPSVHEPLPA
ncbi:hypothetical protein [Streptomyces sp. NPDC013187]